MTQRLPSLQEMLAGLVAAPSISSLDPRIDQSNRAVVDLLATWLDGLGFAIELQPIPGVAGKFNLIATRGAGAGGLVLSGHTDTVPCDETGWQSDPFVLTERDGRLHGLGSSDMKSFFALVLEALRDLPLHDLSAPVTVLATADEESTMSGARALLARDRPIGRYAVIGEPTGLRPIRMHKGVMMLAVRVHGRAGHASDPTLGRSALEGMHRVITALISWRAALQLRHRNDAFAVPVPTVNLGVIRGGDNPNRICAECELQIDIRLLPDMQPDVVRADLHALVAEVLDGNGLSFTVAPMLGAIPPFCCAPGAHLLSVAEEITGANGASVGFATEAPFLQQLGLETIVLGAGDIDVAHQANEYLEISRLAPMTGMLRGLIGRFCRAPAGA